MVATPNRPKVRKDNIEFVSELMGFAKSGPLMQAFIIEAMRQYAERCIKAGAATFDSGFMNGQAWINCAEEVKREIDGRSE